MADHPGRPPVAARDRRSGRVRGDDRRRHPVGGGRAAHRGRRLLRPGSRAGHPARGGPAGRRSAAVPAAVGRRRDGTAAGPGPVRRLRQPGEDAARQPGRARRHAVVRGGRRGPVLRPAPDVNPGTDRTFRASSHDRYSRREHCDPPVTSSGPPDPTVTPMTTSLDELYHEYGTRATAVEPGGAEPIPLADRHGKPSQMFWTWVSPNMEFATIFVGVISVLFFGLTFWQAVGAAVLGSALGGLFHAVLTSWGPERGLAQMVLSRRPFGYRGNLLPAGINAVVAGAGWFAVNSISGALALSALTGWNGYVCLVIGVVLMLVVAFLGHNFVHLFERVAFPALVVVFLAGMAVILPATQTGPMGDAVPGGFWIALGATFGYAAGWNPYASDYSRYLPPGTG